MRMIFTLLIIALGFFLSCNTSSSPHTPQLPQFTVEDIARATVSSLFHKDIDSIETNIIEDLIYTSYDQTVIKVKIDHETIIWATETGRWRDHPLDSKITWTEKKDTLTIIESYSDGSTLKRKFSTNDFK